MNQLVDVFDVIVFSTDHEREEPQVLQSVKISDGNGQTYVQIKRPQSQSPNQNQIFDEVGLCPGQQKQSPIPGPDFTVLLAEVQSKLLPVSATNLGPLIGPDVQSHFAAREEALNRLQSFVENILRDVENVRRQRDEEFREKEQALEDAYKTKESSLEESYQMKAKQVEDQREQLDKFKTSLDDRSSTHARRDIRKDLKEIVGKADRLKVSRETSTRRWAIFGIYTALLVLFGITTGVLMAKELSTEGSFNALLFGHQVVSSLAFVATAGFFLRWINHWTQQIADEELRVKQFELDIDRASWLVEMALEWKSEKGEEIPEHLLARLSRNLFDARGGEDLSMTAADALASAIMGSAMKAKVSMPGADLELDKKGIQQLSKQPAK